MHHVCGELHRTDGNARHADGRSVVADPAVHPWLGVRSRRGAVQHHCDRGECVECRVYEFRMCSVGTYIHLYVCTWYYASSCSANLMCGQWHSCFSSICLQLDWVCDDAVLPAFAQAIFFVGAVVGGLLFGWIADRFGRIPSLMGCNLLGFVFGVATAFTNSFWTFSFCRFMLGFAFDNCFMMMYILGECVLGFSLFDNPLFCVVITLIHNSNYRTISAQIARFNQRRCCANSKCTQPLVVVTHVSDRKNLEQACAFNACNVHIDECMCTQFVGQMWQSGSNLVRERLSTFAGRMPMDGIFSQNTICDWYWTRQWRVFDQCWRNVWAVFKLVVVVLVVSGWSARCTTTTSLVVVDVDLVHGD